MLIGAKVANFDETGINVNGKTIWVHNSSTPELTYQTINARRGQAGMESNGVPPKFGGIAVHDCWSPYWKYGGITYAVCNAHLFQELTGGRAVQPRPYLGPCQIHPPRGEGERKKGKRGPSLNGLVALKASVCLFIRDFNVPFDNNQAERDVHNVKTKTKVSGCFSTESGAQNYLDVMPFISTGRKHGVSAYDALTAAFAGNAEIVLQ